MHGAQLELVARDHLRDGALQPVGANPIEDLEQSRRRRAEVRSALRESLASANIMDKWILAATQSALLPDSPAELREGTMEKVIRKVTGRDTNGILVSGESDVLVRFSKCCSPLPGDRIVLVATASAHREATLQSAAFLIDWLKTKAPFWKLEDDGKIQSWVDAKDSDDRAADRWSR